MTAVWGQEGYLAADIILPFFGSNKKRNILLAVV
jgi:hypothetical protein